MRDGIKKLLAPIPWVLWFALLMSTPYYMLDPYKGGLYSGLYGYVALACIAGAWLAVALSAIFESCPSRAAMAAISLFGGLLSLSILLSEWAYLPVYLREGPESVLSSPLLSSPLGALIRFEPALLCAVSFFCALSVVYYARGSQMEASGALKAAGEGEGPPGERVRLVGILLPLALFLMGFLRSLASAPFLPYMEHPALVQQVRLAAPAVLVPVPLVATFLLGLAVAFVLKRVVGILSEGSRGRSSYAAVVITAFCLGMLCWNMLTRAAPVADAVLLAYPGRVALAQAVVVALMAGMVFLFACARDPRRRAGARALSQPPGEARLKLSDAERALLEKGALTERESMAITLLMRGRTSAESAGEMGIRPSTVRAYLQRAYKKLGVADAEELFRTAQEQDSVPTPCSLQEKASLDSFARRQGSQGEEHGPVNALVALVGVLGTALVLFVPHGIDYAAWGLGREMLAGGGSALVVVGAGGLFLQGAALRGSSIDPSSLRLARRVSRRACACAAGVLTLGSGAVVLCCLENLSLGPGSGKPASSLIFSGASFVLFSGWGLAAARALAVLRAIKSPSRWIVPVGMVFSLALFAASSLSWHAWLLGGAASLAALASVPFYPSHPRRGEKGCMKRLDRDGFLDAAGACVFLALGFAAEETWRALSTFSFAQTTIPFLVLVVLGGVFFSWRAMPSIRFMSLLPALFGLIGLAIGRGQEGLFAGALVQMLLLAAFGLRRRALEAQAFLLWMTAVGCGCLIGMAGVDAVSDLLLLNDTALLAFGGRVELSERLLVLSSVLFIMLGIMGLLFFKRLSDDVHMRSLSVSWGSGADERIMHYFLGRGLNETQVSVLVEIVRGFSSFRISENLNYARGTVNSARDAAYRLLRVHSRAQLIALLKDDTGL